MQYIILCPFYASTDVALQGMAQVFLYICCAIAFAFVVHLCTFVDLLVHYACVVVKFEITKKVICMKGDDFHFACMLRYDCGIFLLLVALRCSRLELLKHWRVFLCAFIDLAYNSSFAVKLAIMSLYHYVCTSSSFFSMSSRSIYLFAWKILLFFLHVRCCVH